MTIRGIHTPLILVQHDVINVTHYFCRVDGVEEVQFEMTKIKTKSK